MGKGSKGKNKAPSTAVAEDDDALLAAAIAENLTAKREAAASETATSPVAGRWEAYKRDTRNFWDWLASKQPSQAIPSVRTMLQAASALSGQGVVLPNDVATRLDNAIALRKEVHRLHEKRSQKPTRDDERHGYFIQALEAAKALLTRPVADQPSAAATAARQSEDDIIALANRFEGMPIEEPADAPAAIEPAGAENLLSLIGSAVAIQGVVSQPTLNGQSAMVTGYDESKGRYEVKVDASGETIRLKPENVRVTLAMGAAEEEKYVMGETMEFEAACLLLDLEGVLKQVDVAWADYAQSRCSLLAAAALTNACVRHAERLASAVSLQTPILSSLENVVCAAYLMRTITWTQSYLGVPLDLALTIVSDITHGSPGDTVLPTLGPHRVIHGVQIYSMLAGEQLTSLSVAEMEASNSALGKARDQIKQNVAANRKGPRSCTYEQMETVLTRVTLDVVYRLAKPIIHSADSGAIQDPEDFYVGSNGLLLTAAFLRVLSSPRMNIVRRPQVWSAPKPGFFGPAWHEERNPASCTNDLTDYMGGSLPALLSFAHGEMRSSATKQVQFPALKMRELMPLWHMLEEAMDKKAATLPMTIALQAMLLSLVRVNGRGRCEHVQMTIRDAFRKAKQQMDRDLAMFTGNAAKGCPNSEINKNNIAMIWSYVDFTNRRHTLCPHSQTSPLSDRQRDQTLLQNPWVAGQQLLVLSLGVGVGCGSAILDSLGQTSFVLHLQNALRVSGAAVPVPLVDDTLMSVLGGENKAVWFAGVPCANFMKAWYHRMGMDATIKTNRKLVAIEPEDISGAYRCAAANDFSGLPLAESANPLPIVLGAIRSAFAADPMVGTNLTALGAKLIALPDRLVDSLGMQGHFQQELTELMSEELKSGGGGRGRGQGSARGGGASEKTRRAALYNTLVAELLNLCERDVPDKNQPFHVGPENKGAFRNAEGREFQGRQDLPPCTTGERGKMEHAGRLVKEFIGSIGDIALLAVDVN